jgi:O-antigen ligase
VARSGAVSSIGPAVEPAVDIGSLVRGVLFIAAFLSFWISFHPFQSLAEAPPELADTGDRTNQIGFSILFLALAAWTWFHEPRRIFLLIRPVLVATLAWCVLSVVTSWDPQLAARRLAFTLVVMAIAGMVLLLPKNLRQFSDFMAAAVLIVLVVSYLGLVLAPQLSIHQATDFLEPEHDGSWRGVFPHKNQAGAAMVLFIFVGLFVSRTRSLVLGGLIVVLAGVFLGFSQSKTAIAVLPLVFVLSAIIGHSRRPAFGIALVVAILAAFNLFSVGSVAFEPVHRLVAMVLPDATFTGRTDIWQLTLQSIAERPITGYGFSAFWGTEQVVFGLAGNASWANAATDAHNAYLNLAVTIGVPGMLLAILWFVVAPVADFYRLSHDGLTGPLQLLFLRSCLYGIYASCFESSILQQIGETWFMFMVAAFGLRLLSVTRVAL